MTQTHQYYVYMKKNDTDNVEFIFSFTYDRESDSVIYQYWDDKWITCPKEFVRTKPRDLDMSIFPIG